MSLRSRLDASWASPRQTGARIALVAVVLAVAAVPFSLLLLFVESRWGPLLGLDDSARDGLHTYALAHPVFVTLMRAASNSGSGPAWQAVTVILALVLLVRRRFRLALFVLVTNAGSSLLNGFVKTAVDRARPVVNHPLLHEPGKSFPSGHAQAAVVGYGVLLFVFLPYVRGIWRRVVVLVAVIMIVAIGFSRIALAAHYVSDVLAAYVLGLAWLAAMASVFHVWRRTDARASAVASTSAPTTKDRHGHAPGARSASDQ